jgi:hypothetical protein
MLTSPFYMSREISFTHVHCCHVLVCILYLFIRTLYELQRNVMLNKIGITNSMEQSP